MDSEKTKAVFFDRDGTINSDVGHYYIYRPEDFVFNPGVIAGMKRLQEAGYLLIVITNQGGVAKGEYTDDDVHRVHDYMCAELQKSGVHIDAIYYCPHHDSIAPCQCRKPSPYMVNQAVEKFNIDREASWFVGDGNRDVECAQAAGVRALKIEKNQDITPVIDTILSTL